MNRRVIVILLNCLIAVLFSECTHTGIYGRQKVDVWIPEPVNDDNPAFTYRAVYSFCSQSREQSEHLKLDNLDFDWGLWGHNLSNVLPKDYDKSVFAKGDASGEQFCFSSAKLFEYTVKYIKDNYDDGNVHGFVIMPNDSPSTCVCAACKRLGNSKGNATPAVTDFIARLANQFPQHRFFTSYYHSTAHMPAQSLPKNVGVLISAIDAPFVKDEVDSGLVRILQRWHKKTPHIYVWDYCRDFDDYFTPYPVLHILQQRLALYHQLGVDGVIINGSGPDYSSFDDMHTYVLACLLVNPDADVDSLVHHHLSTCYPATGSMIEDYYKSIEDRTQHLELYTGIDFALRSYLDKDGFLQFVVRLEHDMKHAGDDERLRLRYLLAALNFTRLEIMRHTEQPSLVAMRGRLLDGLDAHKQLDGMVNFREANGNIDQYVEYMRHNETFDLPDDNLLSHVHLECHSPLDEGSRPVSCLTDGFLGIPYDYHVAWMLFSGDTLHLTIPPTKVAPATMRIGMLLSVPWCISGCRVLAQQGGVQVWGESPVEMDKKISRAVISLDLKGMRPGSPIELYLIKTGRKIAVDEIQLLSEHYEH